MAHVILASGSPRRKELLGQILKDFDVIPSSYEEDMTLKKDPQELALHLSEGKAEDVANHFPDAIVIGVDTFVVVDDEMLGKPKDLEDAKLMLAKESGKAQFVISGVTILQKSEHKKKQCAVVTKVFFKNLTAEQITQYVSTHEVLDKSGSYAIQEIGEMFVDKIEGSYTNIMGLPVDEVKDLLREFEIHPS